MKYWIADDKAKPIFANIFERSCVWAAFSERNYEGIGVCGGLGGKPRQMFEITTFPPTLQLFARKSFQQFYKVVQNKNLMF